MNAPDTSVTGVDRLSALLERFRVRAHLFHAGPLCGVTPFAAEPGRAFLHVLRRGEMEVMHRPRSGAPRRLRLNQPTLRDKLPPLPMYWFVRQQIAFAGRYGLRGPRDLINYLCLALVAGTRFDLLPRVKPVLAQVKAGTLPFEKAMDALSEVIDDKDLQPAKLLLDDAGRPLQEAALSR